MILRAGLLLATLATICLSKYTRNVSYQAEVLIKCSDLERSTVQDLLESAGVDVWHVGRDGSVDFRVSSEQFQVMKGDLPGCREAGSVEDIVVRREERNETGKRAKIQAQQEWFEDYHDYEEIVKWYEELSMAHPDLVTFVPSIGQSLEGRDQPALHITATGGGEEVNKIFFQCQIHAREWISGAVCQYLAYQMTEKYGTDERVTGILDSVEFVFVIFMNPDGYEYTWTNDRLWRKNRRPATGGCSGVDLNRNYPYKWGESGGSSNPCSETYFGTGPASEPETQNAIEYFRKNFPIVGSVDWHSYSQLLLRPYGWTREDAPDEIRMKELADEMSVIIFDVNGKRYVSQKAIDLYQTSGTARDWFYSEEANEGNKYRSPGYTIELRDTGEYGFLLPPDQIIPTGEEIFPAVLYFAEELNRDPIQK